MQTPTMICRRLLLHPAESAADLARFNAGRSIAARIAMTAMTSSSSISVNAFTFLFIGLFDAQVSMVPLLLRSDLFPGCATVAGAQTICYAVGGRCSTAERRG